MMTNYRREIDGLRALAILSVVLFHAGFQTFRGGFVGVDVFFVISGFLISSLLLADLKTSRFSIIDFYERRARRILPALFFVIAVCLPMAWLWLFPLDLKSFSTSLISVPLFASNILYWKKSSYFDAAIELTPLLHTWSLAVEEQFYLFFPLLLGLLWKSGQRRMLALLGVLFAISLAASQWGATAKPAATFYLLPTRGWELLLGTFLASYLNQQSALPRHRRLHEMGAVAGLAAVAGSVFCFSKNIPFPSLYALVPTLGAACIILFATPQTITGKILGNRLLAGIGLISYSVYLWHQPLFGFARYVSADEPGQGVMLALSLASLVLGYGTWKWVETPFRARQCFTRQQIFLAAGLVSVLVMLIGLAGYVTKGFPSRYSPENRALLALQDKNLNYNQSMAEYGLGKCFILQGQSYQRLVAARCVTNDSHPPRVVVFGDSYAAHWMPGIRRLLPGLGYDVQQWTAAGCRAIGYSESSKRCAGFYHAFITNVVPTLNSGDILVISSRWQMLFNSAGKSTFVHGLRNLFDLLKKKNIHVVVIGNSPEFPKLPSQIMINNNISNKGQVFLTSRDLRSVNDTLRQEAQNYGFRFLDPYSVLCHPTNPIQCMAADHGELLFVDTGHLSVTGSIFAMGSMVKYLGLEIHGIKEADSKAGA